MWESILSILELRQHSFCKVGRRSKTHVTFINAFEIKIVSELSELSERKIGKAG